MKAGSAADDGNTGFSVATAYVLDMTQPSPAWRSTAAMAYPRSFLNLTMLPDGSVLSTGGGTDRTGFDTSKAILPAELWSPVSETWTTLASMQTPRLYHSTALLLPDARVLVAGGGADPGVVDQPTAEIFSPPYLFKGPRPTISATPLTLAYGSNFVVATPDAASISSVSLVTIGSVTHSFNQNQHFLTLNFQVTPDGLSVAAPANSMLAPPGYYLLFILNGNGVPSVGAFLNLPVSPPVAVPNVVNLTQAAATTTLQNAGLAVGAVSNLSSAMVPLGSVISESPVAGTLVAFGSAVNLVVSAGPPVTVPNVVNLTQAAATTAITGAGLTVGAVTTAPSATVAAGSVISESPVAGTQVALGSAVSLVVSTGPAGLTVDRVAFSDGTGTRTISGFSTAAAGELLVVFAASDGPVPGTQTLTVAGAGLTWTLVRRVNTQAGTSEIWRATAPTVLTNVSITSTQGSGSYAQSLTLVAFTGAVGTGISVGANASTGAPTVSLTTSQAGSFVYGVGNDWDNAIARTPGAAQTLVHQYLAPSGDTMWTQNRSDAIASTGTVASINDTAPTGDRWNLVAVEILAASSSGLVTVPNAVNLTQAAATTAITGAGLVVGTVSNASSATVPAGSVISQNPVAGTQVAAGNAVNLVVSTGPGQVAVPNVVNLTQAAATTTITGVGLVVGTVTNATNATVPAGSVISQNPVAGTQVTAGSAVNLAVSTGPAPVVMPDVVNLTQSVATTTITGAGLVVGTVTNATSATVPAGSVISQNPVAGTQVAAGSAVALVVSLGPPIAVPNVVGMTQSAASTTLTNAGLSVGAITSAASSTVPAGSVISQNPTAGTPVAPGTAVALVISTGPPPANATVDVMVSSDGSGTRTSPSFSTSATGDVLVAFAGSDGPTSGNQTLTISGAGLQWWLVQRANGQHGTSEIWTATAASQLTNVTVTSMQRSSGYHQSLTVVAFKGASGVGASAAAGATSGAPTVSLTTTRDRSLVYGMGNDWDNPIARVLGANQTLVHQWVDTSTGDTYWAQAASAAIALASTVVRLNDTSPTTDRWNFVSVEIVSK